MREPKNNEPLNGGPAFPTAYQPNMGLSRRDWFAGQALAGILMTQVHPNFESAASMAFGFADAMLEASKDYDTIDVSSFVNR